MFSGSARARSWSPAGRPWIQTREVADFPAIPISSTPGSMNCERMQPTIFTADFRCPAMCGTGSKIIIGRNGPGLRAARCRGSDKLLPFRRLGPISTTAATCLPLLHWRGGSLSICQWSRLLDVARHRLRKAFDAPIRVGLSNLGLAGESVPKDESRTSPGRPIMMISLRLGNLSRLGLASPTWHARICADAAAAHRTGQDFGTIWRNGGQKS